VGNFTGDLMPSLHLRLCLPNFDAVDWYWTFAREGTITPTPESLLPWQKARKWNNWMVYSSDRCQPT